MDYNTNADVSTREDRVRVLQHSDGPPTRPPRPPRPILPRFPIGGQTGDELTPTLVEGRILPELNPVLPRFPESNPKPRTRSSLPSLSTNVGVNSSPVHVHTGVPLFLNTALFIPRSAAGLAHVQHADGVEMQARRAGLCGLQSRQYQDLGYRGYAFFTRAGYVGAAVTTVPGS